MEKIREDFERRGSEKIVLDTNNISKRVKVGEIWLTKIGMNIGSEISKNDAFIRPVLVLNTWLGGDLVMVIPLSTKCSENYKKYYIPFENYQDFGVREKSYFVLNQARPMSMKRLVRKINNIIVDDVEYPPVPRDFIYKLSEMVKKILFL